tara:strand:- start:1370 stop:1849 length:480 start_codon:yes stop_codon:yes gene_type:complete
MNEHFEKQIQNALAVIKELQLEDFIKYFDGKDGFMWSSDSRIYQIGEKLEGDGHSGASFAFTLRECQWRLINEEPDPDPEPEVPEIDPPEPPEMRLPEPPNKEGIKIVGENIYNEMDDNNKKATDIMASQGMDKAIEHMFLHPETGEPMDYATMRHFYG